MSHPKNPERRGFVKSLGVMAGAALIQPATDTPIPEASEAQTVPASVSKTRAMASLALRCRSVISTNSAIISMQASITQGSTLDAPSAVLFPEQLITARSPHRARILSAGSAGRRAR